MLKALETENKDDPHLKYSLRPFLINEYDDLNETRNLISLAAVRVNSFVKMFS
jgi:hypothetical protein